MNIKRNKLADKAAKNETKLQRSIAKSYTSLTFIKRKVKESALTKWHKIWQVFKNKDKHYSQFECKSKWKMKEKTVKKQIWSTYI